MRQTVQNKITNIKTLAKSSASNSIAKSSNRIVNDNLSKSIRTENDAKVFRKELSIAFKLAKE
jgi:catabolite regulation protein CreA